MSFFAMVRLMVEYVLLFYNYYFFLIGRLRYYACFNVMLGKPATAFDFFLRVYDINCKKTPLELQLLLFSNISNKPRSLSSNLFFSLYKIFMINLPRRRHNEAPQFLIRRRYTKQHRFPKRLANKRNVSCVVAAYQLIDCSVHPASFVKGR